MADNFILDFDPGWDAAVLTFNVQQQRNELTLIDTSTLNGKLKFALMTTRCCVWAWQPIDWQLRASPLADRK